MEDDKRNYIVYKIPVVRNDVLIKHKHKFISNGVLQFQLSQRFRSYSECQSREDEEVKVVIANVNNENSAGLFHVLLCFTLISDKVRYFFR